MHTVDIVDFIDKLSSDIAAHVKLIIYKEACHNFSKYDCYYLKCFLIISLNRLKRAFDIMDLKDFLMSGIFSIDFILIKFDDHSWIHAFLKRKMFTD
ncbi:hypothetical protein T02_2595 [Trichinella nativa]|uniref:Uncharacterized protein n=1 Tax=Trichinella nativa TaxID=6335 RepID=A0A0V1LIM0_9BILA|nr:hypothetical protein T02_2595 [Trichinella nativa]